VNLRGFSECNCVAFVSSKEMSCKHFFFKQLSLVSHHPQTGKQNADLAVNRRGGSITGLACALGTG
jgi:hypothetical protein